MSTNGLMSSMLQMFQGEKKDESLPRYPPVIVRIVLFLGIVNTATCILACSQCRIPFYLEGSNAHYNFPGKLLLFSGSYLTITSAVSILKSAKLLRITIYSLAQSLIVALLLVSIAGSSAFAMKSTVSHGLLNASLLQDLELVYSEDVRVTFAWNQIQKKFQCCGVKGPQDWLNSRWYYSKSENNNATYPDTCCDRGYGCNNSTVNYKGCGNEATLALRHRLVWIYLCSFISVPVHLTSYLLLSFLEKKV